jgi:hypothetical protein
MPVTALSRPVREHGYVTNPLVLPLTRSDYARDIDHDGDVDNRFGQFIGALAGQNVDIQTATSAAVSGGDLLMLHSLRTPSLTNTRNATWQVLYAEPTPSPDFSGSGSFTAASKPRSARLPAKIKDGHVKTAAGTIPVKLTAGAGLFTLKLKNAKVFATCSRPTCTNGRINGAIPASQLNSKLIPDLADQFTAIIARDCPGADSSSCAGGSEGSNLDAIFDGNDDLVITADELQSSGLAHSLLAPDIDLSNDGVPDALSFGFGFTAAGAHLAGA